MRNRLSPCEGGFSTSCHTLRSQGRCESRCGRLFNYDPAPQRSSACGVHAKLSDRSDADEFVVGRAGFSREERQTPPSPILTGLYPRLRWFIDPANRQKRSRSSRRFTKGAGAEQYGRLLSTRRFLSHDPPDARIKPRLFVEKRNLETFSSWGLISRAVRSASYLVIASVLDSKKRPPLGRALLIRQATGPFFARLPG